MVTCSFVPPRKARAQQNIWTQSAPLRLSMDTQPSLVAPVVNTSSIRMIRRPFTKSFLLGCNAKALPTAFLRRLKSRPRMLGVRLCRTKISGTKAISLNAASWRPIRADWLKVRDHMRVQWRGTGVMTRLSRSSGKCRTICCAMTRAKPIFPPYFSRSATFAERSSYLTAARMPSCRGGIAIQLAQYASCPRSNSKGAAHPRQHGGPRNSSCCQHVAQNGPPADVILPQQGQRSGKAQFNAN